MYEPVKSALKLLTSANQLSKEKVFCSLGVLIFFLMCCSARKTRKRKKQGEECDQWGPTCRDYLKFHLIFFLNLSRCSAVDTFAEKLSVQPALLLDIRASEAAAVCPELS